MTRMKLDKFIEKVRPAGRGRPTVSKFDPFQSEILSLRERGYSFSQVCEFLEQNSVKALPSEVQKYVAKLNKENAK